MFIFILITQNIEKLIKNIYILSFKIYEYIIIFNDQS